MPRIKKLELEVSRLNIVKEIYENITTIITQRYPLGMDNDVN